ncbi:hypothetical protein [Chitinasiproducens palmae]|uniref:Uncharacterized protein n=1 Tax=Chitinasiproducens palmae TaxID=1770053 RepID=A0A1H2PPC1_9BURK|nr:hypothetical protein [Chitinasiproducens palmae]SDV48563.1 hypothetical protein SAMN05216551_105193 [Chitinasiproducens palmae]
MASTRHTNFDDAQIGTDSRQYDHFVFGVGTSGVPAWGGSTYGLQHFSPLQLDCPTSQRVLDGGAAKTKHSPLKRQLSSFFRRFRHDERNDIEQDEVAENAATRVAA